MQVRDKVVVVTGGVRGIGRALCSRFSDEGARAVVMLDVDTALASEVTTAIGAVAMECDVADEPQLRHCVRLIEAEFGGIDLFCANAGIAHAGGLEVSNQDWQRVMDVNFMSHVYSARAAVPGMLSRGGGYFLHTASAAGLLTQIGSAPYAVSKHAAVAFAEWLSMTYGDQGIGVSCLCPLGVLTDMVQGDDPVLASLRKTAITTDVMCDAVIAGLSDESFLILPHPEVTTYLSNKVSDPDRWLRGMRKLQRGLLGPQTPNDSS